MSRVTNRQQYWKSVDSSASSPQTNVSPTIPTATNTINNSIKDSAANSNKTGRQYHFTQNESVKKKSSDALPDITATGNTKALRFPRPPFSKTSGESGSQSNTTDKQAESRTQLAQTVAAHLLKAALDRQPNVLPVFSNDPEKQVPYMLPKDEALLRPEKKLLITPCLGLAACANAITVKSSCFPILPDEAARRLEKERSLNRVLFSWWENRNACRQSEDAITSIEEELRGQLWDCFKQFLTEEEERAMHELKRNHQTTLSGKLGDVDGDITTRVGGSRSVNGKGIMSSLSDSVVKNLPTSDRGISMPLELYERLFLTVMHRIHRRFLMLLRCQGSGTICDTDTSRHSSLPGNTYVQFLLNSEIEMIEAGERISDHNDVAPTYLPLVTLPEERCFRPLLAAETAFSVALLWRILDQTKSMVPGMAWALQLFTRYLLPHVYENFTPCEQLLPRAGAIGEQVEQLYALQLNLIRQRSMKAATVQAKEDVRYLETFMKSWAWRTWRQGAVGQKRREAALVLLEKIFKRLHNAIRLQKTFREWRLTAKEGRFKSQLDEIERKYSSFLTGAQHAARNVQFFPEFGEGMEGFSSAMPDKQKFVAMKLAETAQHTKERKIPNSISEEAKISEKSSQSSTEKSMQESPTGMEEDKSQEQQQQGGYVDNSNNEIIRPSEMKSIPQTFLTSVTRENTHSSEGTALQKRAVETFEGMLKKLEEMETISGYLRQEIAIQNRLIQKLERENNSLKGRATELEEALFNSEEKRLHFCNLVQERELDVRELERRIAQLKSRVRCQQQRPWQRTVMRVVGEMCGASTTASEYTDDRRVARNMKTNTVEIGGMHKDNIKRNSIGVPLPAASSSPSTPGVRRGLSLDATAMRGEDATSMLTVQQQQQQQQSLSSPAAAVPTITVDNERSERDNGEEIPELTPGAEEERLFGKIAPLVISSTRYMPDAQTILRDWANNCLDDLESLDDLKGGALSTRFHNFSEEVRSGVLLSRLLFYLALPRYQNKTAVAHTTVEGISKRLSENLDFTEQRRQLLMQHNVQLEAPFPTYSECFGDLLNLKPSGRMSLLLQFATELMEGPEQLGDEYIQKRMNRIREAAIKATEMTPPQPADRVEMMEIVDPYGLARGDRAAVLTFIALLYVRFAHPFNHKARQSAMIEREAMLYLLSNGTYLLREHSSRVSVSEESEKEEGTEKQLTESIDTPITRELLAQLEEEERSPWQLFLKYCQPLISAMAHPFILRGNFWPSVAFDSPELAQMLGALGVALHRSLEVHRWHIIVSCLVPVNTYSSLSRGIFTGRRASPSALQVGLDREGDWVFALDMPCIKNVFLQREEVIRKAIENGTMKRDSAWHDDEWRNEGYFIELDKSYLMKSFGNCGNDLLQLFLRRSSLSSSSAMPSIDLGGWRMLWIDTGLVIPDDPEGSRVDLEQLTRIFYLVSTTLMETRRESRVIELHMDDWNIQQLPSFVSELYYPDFLAAVIILTHELFPVLDSNTDGSTESITWLGDGLSQLIFKHVAPKLLLGAMEDPIVIVKSIRSNIKTEEVLVRHNKVLMTIFHSYCKEVCGVSGMEREQLLQMLRDAMLTSTEISQNLIFELFQPFSVSKKTEEALREEKRREQDAKPRDVPVQRRRGNVSILDPNSDQPMLTGRNKEFNVLLYDGFIDFLCVLCHFKQPNPLIPFDQRMETFLRRGLLRPLSHRNDVLASIMSNEKRQMKQEHSS